MTAEIVDFQKYREQKERALKQTEKVKPESGPAVGGDDPKDSPSEEALDNDGGNHDGGNHDGGNHDGETG